jgi:hypothetical protein
VHTARTGEIAAVKYLGKPFFEWISESPQLAEIQNAATADGGRSARGDLLAAYKLPGGGTVADMGGADGTLLAEFLAGEPERRGIVFDLPNVVAAATRTLAEAGLSDRVTAIGGDFFESVPAADTYLMSVVLHDWDNAAASRILRNCGPSTQSGDRSGQCKQRAGRPVSTAVSWHDQPLCNALSLAVWSVGGTQASLVAGARRASIGSWAMGSAERFSGNILRCGTTFRCRAPLFVHDRPGVKGPGERGAGRDADGALGRHHRDDLAARRATEFPDRLAGVGLG